MSKNSPLKPLHDYVVLELVKDEQASSSLLVVPGESQNQLAKVIEVGPGVLLSSGQRASLQVQVGDLVLLPPNRKYESMHLNGVSFVLVREGEILGIVNK